MIDFSNYLRNKKFIDDPYAGMDASIPPVAVPNMQPKIGHVSMPEPDPNPAMTAYKTGVKQEPMLADYHPSRLRNILSRIAGGAVGAFQGGAAGQGIQRQLEYGPYLQKHDTYNQQQAQRGQLAGIESVDEKTIAERALNAGKIGELGARAEAERQRGLREAHTASSYVPTNLDETLKINQSKVRPPTPPAPFRQYIPPTGEFISQEDPTKPPTSMKVGSPTALSPEKAAENKLLEADTRTKAQDRRQQTSISAADRRHQETMAHSDAQMKDRFSHSDNAATASTKTTAATAEGILKNLPRTRQEIDKVQAQLGPAAGRWNDFWTGKVGVSNADLNKLRTDLEFINSGVVKAHIGARGSKEVREAFTNLNNSKFQSPENMKAFLDTAEQWMKTYSEAGKRATSSEAPPAAKSYADWAREQGIK